MKTNCNRTFARICAPLMAAALLVLPAIALAAAPEAGGHGGDHSEGIAWLSPIINNTGKTGLVWLFLNFAVLMWILNKVLFSKLKVSTAAKSDTIKQELGRATKARTEAESIIKEYRGRMERLDDEVAELLADAKRRAEADKAEIIKAAQQEATRIKAAAAAAAVREAQSRQQKIENDIVDAAIARAESVIREKIGAGDQRKMVGEYVASLGAMDLGGPGGLQ